MKTEILIEVEQHFIDAAKALRCAWRKTKNAKNFRNTSLEISSTVLEIEESAKEIRQFIDNR